MRNINYLSDFDLIVTLKTCDGTDIGFPDYDFKLFFYTYSKVNGFTASSIGGKYTNLYNDNGKIHVVFDNHKLGSGELKVDFTALLPNGLYPDGDKKLVVPQPLDVKLVRDKGDCIKDIDVEVIMPYELIADDGMKLTQKDPDVSIEHRILASKVMLGKGCSADEWTEISQEEAEKIKAQQEELAKKEMEER